MNSSRPDNGMLVAQPSLWRRAPAWRYTLVMAAVATSAAMALLVDRGASEQQTMPAAPAGSTVLSAPPPATGSAVAEQAAISDSPTPATVRVENSVATKLPDGPMHEQEAHAAAPVLKPAERAVVKAPKPVSRAEPHLQKSPALAVANTAEVVTQPKPTSPMMVQLPEMDSACPNLARLIPLTEPRYNQGQVAAVRSAEVSANTTRRSMAELGATMDAKYQYQIHAVLLSKTPMLRNGKEIHIATIVPPDLHVQPGDIVAWDGAYRDAPGTCHYVPARVRAVLGHAELPSAPARSEASAPPESQPEVSVAGH